MKFSSCLFAFLAFAISSIASDAAELDKREQLEHQKFWSNQDFEWYEQNIPFFECPDGEITTTYYYRWELVTRHLCYGSPDTGYLFTEFANRPFWSGRYGAISCPTGHQFNEIRWLRDPTFARDYLRYWFHTPGAQPRNYSSWLADCTWAVHQVHPADSFTVDLLPDLVKNYEAWKQRQWVPEMGLFWQLGHDDGMEFDINARQTNDILRGGQSLRPSFNAYMWADARALSRIATLAGDHAMAARFDEEAKGIQSKLHEHLWDAERSFFFPMSHQEHKKNGHLIKRHTLTYQSGEFAGSPHGRELHGYVPWAFGMVRPGHEDAWKFLMDPDYFYADFGPTTVERNDPMFALKDGCCWWSGQSWPFATTQTLKAMANLLQTYDQSHVDRDDYTRLLHHYAISHRKEGKPYIAEALHPLTGSWKGHDIPNRSEHYFHSGFNDLVITGLVGLRPGDGETLVIDPLAPQTWDYFALDDLPYQGHRLTILWDKTGDRYGHGRGLHLIVDGKRIATQEKLGRMKVTLPAVDQVPVKKDRPLNYAVNNDGDYYPRYTASYVSPDSSLAEVYDGQFGYDIRPSKRWTAAGSNNPTDWIEIDFGQPRPLHAVKLYLLDDGETIVPPKSLELLYTPGDSATGDGEWVAVPEQKRSSEKLIGRRPTEITFAEQNVRRLRIVLEHADDGKAGLTEIEAWGAGTLPYESPRPPAGNIAFSREADQFPKASASFSDVYGGTPEKANDGKINYQPNPVNRWTSYGSPNASDWLMIDFGKPTQCDRVELLIYDDRGGVQPPQAIRIDYFDGEHWQLVCNTKADPIKPTGNMSNSYQFDPVTATKIRAVFIHQGDARSGVTEMEVWADGAHDAKSLSHN